MQMAYPQIHKPRQSATGYVVVIERSGDEREELAYPTKKAAEEGYAALQLAQRLLTPKLTPKIDNIRGPYFDRSQARWNLRWTEDGDPRAQTNSSRQPLAAKRQALLGGPAQKKLVKALPRNFDGSATAFKRAISKAAVALSRAAAAGDEGSLVLLRRYVAGLKDLAGAIVPHAGYLELEEEQEALTQYVEDIHAGRAVIEGAPKSKASARSLATLAGRARPGESAN